MKTKVLAIILIIAMIAIAGCRNSRSTQTGLPNPVTDSTVTTEKDFLSFYKGWTVRLDSMADKTDSIYNDWVSGKINTEDFLTELRTLLIDMKALNRETDLRTDFNLIEKDKEMVNYDAIVKGYGAASKDLNDFLEYAPHLADEKIKIKYDEMIKNKYRNDISELKNNLKM